MKVATNTKKKKWKIQKKGDGWIEDAMKETNIAEEDVNDREIWRNGMQEMIAKIVNILNYYHK